MSIIIISSSKYFITTQINDVVYIGTSNMGLAYSGSGTTILPSAALRVPTTGQIGKAFTPSSNIYVGNATASIVEIS